MNKCINVSVDHKRRSCSGPAACPRHLREAADKNKASGPDRDLLSEISESCLVAERFVRSKLCSNQIKDKQSNSFIRQIVLVIKFIYI